MYRRSKRGSGCLIFVVLLGVLLGAIYFARDQIAQTPAQNLVLLPSATPTFKPDIQAQPLTQRQEQPTELPLPTDQPSVLLVVPNANVAAPIIPIFLGKGGSWDVSQLGFNAGHLDGTAWVDHPGNMVLAGHVEMADGSPGIFSHLKELHPGDQALLILSPSETRTYRVEDVRDVQPDDLSVLYPTPSDELTLITCGDYDFASNTYLQRLVVTTTRLS